MRVLARCSGVNWFVVIIASVPGRSTGVLAASPISMRANVR
jgi:hypothetical protein